MAIYRTGQASMDAQGYITGYGTGWSKQLTLIRSGATIVFNTTPVSFAVISEVISDTSMRAIQTNGQVIDRMDYVILLHDSLTVDGLAQDVAETLRYYQGKETEFERFIEIVKNMDPDEMGKWLDGVKKEADRAAAEAAKSHQSSLAAQGASTVASEQADRAAQQVTLAAAEVQKAKDQVGLAAAEVNKAAAEVGKAAQEVEKAKEQVTLANNASDFASEQANNAADAAGRSTVEADRAAAAAKKAEDLANQFDASKTLLKDKNLSDLTDKAAARRNLGVDNITSYDTETRVMTKGKDAWLSLRQADRKWGFWDEAMKSWHALGVEQGGTGAKDAAGARKNIGVDRVVQDANMTRILSADPKTELRIGQDDWYVYRTGTDSTAGYVELGIQCGGTGAGTVQEARDNLGVGEAQTVRFGTIKLSSSYSNPLLIESEHPTIKFSETGNNPGYALVFDGGNWRFQREDNGQALLSYSNASNEFTMTRARFSDINSTRDALNLGVKQAATFGGVFADSFSDAASRESGILNVRSFNAAGNSQINYGRFYAERRGDGKDYLTLHLNSRGNVNRYISFDQDGHLEIPSDIKCRTFDGQSIEVGRRFANSSAYVDFHYSGKYDHDARIICDGMNQDKLAGGNLRFFAGLMEFKCLSSHGFTFHGGKVVNQFDGDIVTFKNSTQNKANYIIGKNADNSNRWYIGCGSDSNPTFVTLNNYAQNCGIDLQSEIVLRGKDTRTTGSLKVDGSSIYVRGGSGTDNTHLWLQNSSGRNRAVFYSSDTQVLGIRSDNASTGAAGQALNFYGATGEARAIKFTATSDERAKFWIKPVTGALDKVCSLRGVTYSMHTTIQNTVRNAGVIAQDVQKVLPEAVSVTKGKDHNVLNKNCDKVENPLTLDYNALSALYIEAIKELKAEVDNLKAEIEILKSK